MLKKCIYNTESILPIEGLGVKDNLSYEEFPVQIFYNKVKILRNKEVDSAKRLWKNHLIEGATRKAEPKMKSNCLHLFDN